MAMMNENSWNSLQSGLRRVNEDIAYKRLRDSHSQYLSQYPAAQTGSGSPRLPRLSSAESERSLGGADLRRASYNLVPPVKRSASVESATSGKQNNRQPGVYTPPKYFNNRLDRRKRGQFKKVPNNSISNFMQQQSHLREAERDVSVRESPPVDPRHPTHNYGSRERDRHHHNYNMPSDWPINTAGVENDDPFPIVYSSRNCKNRNKFDYHAMDDASLAPTPESEIEMKRKIYLRDREAAPIGPRSSLDAFVEKLKHEDETYLGEKAVGSNAALQYFPPRGRRNFDIRRNRGFSPPERDISDHERAVEGIVENFIWDVLEEDLIPDLLIETLKDSDIANMVPVTQRRKEERASSGAELHVTEPKTRMDARNELMHFRAWEEDMLRKRLEFSGQQPDHFKLGGPEDALVTGVISQPTEYPQLINPQYADGTFSSFWEPIVRTVQFDTIMSVVDDTVSDMMPDIVRESLFDVILEDYITTSLVPEVVEEESREMVMQTLKQFDGRVESKQRKCVNMFAREKLLDSSSLEHMLTLIAKNGQIFTDDVHKGRILDDVIVTQLLSQYVNVRNQLNFTITNAPLRRLHERLVSNVACDVILDELTEQLDEDLEDLHEYETSIDNPKLLQESLRLAATSEAFPEGLKDWIMSVENAFAATASSNAIDNRPPQPQAYNRYVLDALLEPTAEPMSCPQPVDILPSFTINNWFYFPKGEIGDGKGSIAENCFGPWNWLFTEESDHSLEVK